MKKPKRCEYYLNEPDLGGWHFSCGYEGCFDDGTPAKNGWRYCPKCGRRIKRAGK